MSLQVTVEATLEHPFFVFGQGWSSCSPERTLQRYGLQCSKLLVGDVCISLTHKDPVPPAPSLLAQQQQQQAHGQQQVEDCTSQISEQRGTSSPAKSSPGLVRSVLPRKVGPDARHTVDATPQSHSEMRITAPRDGGTVMELAGLPATRRRRWSAPDQIHTDSSSSHSVGRVSTPGAQSTPHDFVPVVPARTHTGLGMPRQQRSPQVDSNCLNGKQQQQQAGDEDRDHDHSRT